VDERPIHDLAEPTVAPNVAMVRSGSRGVTPSWFMAGAGELVRLCLEMADVVIFDTGPITLTNEASALLPHVDTGLLVVRAGRVGPDQALGAIEQLTQVGAHVSGIVLVGPDAGRRYGYGYYAASTDDDAAGTTPDERPGSVDPEEAVGSPWNTNRPPGDGKPGSDGDGDASAASRAARRRQETSGHAPM
jgi:hypothetical protein